MQHTDNFTVLTPPEFIKDVRRASGHAQFRIWAQAMDVEPGDIADSFFQVFLDAARKGIDTRVHSDSFSVMLTEGVFNYWPFVSPAWRRMKQRVQAAKRALEHDMRTAGVKFLYTNPPTVLDRLFPVRDEIT